MLVCQSQRSFNPALVLGLTVQSSELCRGNEDHVRFPLFVDAGKVIRTEGPAVNETVHKRRTARANLLMNFTKETMIAVSPARHRVKNRHAIRQRVGQFVDALKA